MASNDGNGGGCLGALGLAMLVIGGLYLAATVQTGGIRQVDESGQTTQVLTWQGWRPAGPESMTLPAAPLAERPAPTSPPPPARAPVIVYPTSAPAPTWPPAPARATKATAPAAPAPAPAWEVLGWVLCVLVGLGGTAGLGVLLYRQVKLTRAQAAAIRAGSMGNQVSVPPPPAPSAKDDKGPRASGAGSSAGRPADGATVPVSEYLGQCLEV